MEGIIKSMDYVKVPMEVDGQEIIIGATPELLHEVWKVEGEDNERETLLKLGSVIVANHDYRKPLNSEYIFTDDINDSSLDQMLDWLL